MVVEGTISNDSQKFSIWVPQAHDPLVPQICRCTHSLVEKESQSSFVSNDCCSINRFLSAISSREIRTFAQKQFHNTCLPEPSCHYERAGHPHFHGAFHIEVGKDQVFMSEDNLHDFLSAFSRRNRERTSWKSQALALLCMLAAS
jgi:hypothetical protein